MFCCKKGNHRFSETGYNDLFGKHGCLKECEPMCKLNSYDLSTDTIADVLDKESRAYKLY